MQYSVRCLYFLLSSRFGHLCSGQAGVLLWTVFLKLIVPCLSFLFKTGTNFIGLLWWIVNLPDVNKPIPVVKTKTDTETLTYIMNKCVCIWQASTQFPFTRFIHIAQVGRCFSRGHLSKVLCCKSEPETTCLQNELLKHRHDRAYS